MKGRSLRTRTPAPGVATTTGRSLGLDIKMAVLEVGASYEVARLGVLAFDIVAGARYWHQEADLSLEVGRTVEIGDLKLVGGSAIARSRSIDWLDPLLGAQIRYALTSATDFFCVATSAGSASEAISPGRLSAATALTSALTKGSPSPA